MNKVYVLDACALIALLLYEDGADNVARAYDEANSGDARIVINTVNLLEVYYDLYRAYDKETADDMLANVDESDVRVISDINRVLLTEAGRLKATYKISLADSFALAQAKVTNGLLLTSDHHEFDTIEGREPIRFMWIR